MIMTQKKWDEVKSLVRDAFHTVLNRKYDKVSIEEDDGAMADENDLDNLMLVVRKYAPQAIAEYSYDEVTANMALFRRYGRWKIC
jgi:hypothetical protein